MQATSSAFLGSLLWHRIRLHDSSFRCAAHYGRSMKRRGCLMFGVLTQVLVSSVLPLQALALLLSIRIKEHPDNVHAMPPRAATKVSGGFTRTEIGRTQRLVEEHQSTGKNR